MDSLEKDRSSHHLLAAVERLSLPELEQFVHQVIALQASRRAPHLSAEETTLLKCIYQTLPDERKARLQMLITKREAESLTVAEYEELTTLTDQLEALQAERLAALAALAQRRGTTLSGVMAQLGVRFPDHD
jgi:hypothetical protein